jgi:hypothetical protein
VLDDPKWRKELLDPEHPEAMAELLLCIRHGCVDGALYWALDCALDAACCEPGFEAVARHMLKNGWVNVDRLNGRSHSRHNPNASGSTEHPQVHKPR